MADGDETVSNGSGGPSLPAVAGSLWGVEAVFTHKAWQRHTDGVMAEARSYARRAFEAAGCDLATMTEEVLHEPDNMRPPRTIVAFRAVHK